MLSRPSASISPLHHWVLVCRKLRREKSAVLSWAHQYDSKIALFISGLSKNNNDFWITCKTCRPAAQIATESLLPCFEHSRLLWQVAEFALSSRVIGSLFMHMRAYYFFPRLICACETSCFHFAHNGSAHAAPHACSASGTPGNSSPVCLLMHTPTLFCFFLCLRNLTVFYLSLTCIWYLHKVSVSD